MKTIKEAKIQNKKVLLRCDFNVDIDEKGKIIDDFRIKKAIPTIKYLLENKNKVIILSHLGRPKPQTSFSRFFSKKQYSLKPIAIHLSKLLGKKVTLIPNFKSFWAQRKIKRLVPGEIVLLENLRYFEGEEKNDESFAKHLSKIGEVYVNDAFGASHRNHASIVSLPKFLPSFVGLLFEEEIKNLEPIIKNPERPLVIIVGGKKVDTKVPIIGRLLNLSDHLLIGGKIANTILAGKGYAIGKFLIDPKIRQIIDEIELTNPKIHLPVDGVVSLKEIDQDYVHIAAVGRIRREEECFDIGPETTNIFLSIIKEAKTIVWNGPLGLTERKEFTKGSLKVAEAITRSGARSIIGGGDTIKFANKHRLLERFNFVSTGGGAMLDFLAYGSLPGIEALNKYAKEK